MSKTLAAREQIVSNMMPVIQKNMSEDVKQLVHPQVQRRPRLIKLRRIHQQSSANLTRQREPCPQIFGKHFKKKIPFACDVECAFQRIATVYFFPRMNLLQRHEFIILYISNLPIFVSRTIISVLSVMISQQESR